MNHTQMITIRLVWCVFLGLQEKDGVKSEAKLSAVYRAHHNARILCVMEHPTLKTRLNASILLDVQCKWILNLATLLEKFVHFSAFNGWLVR